MPPDTSGPSTANDESDQGKMDDDLIIRALQGRATSEELEELRRWCSTSVANERRYRDLEKVWVMTEGAALSEEVESAPPDPEMLIRRAELADDSPVGPVLDDRNPSGAPSEASEPRRAVRPRRRWPSVLRHGLVAAGLAAVGFGLAFLSEDLGLIPRPLAAHAITTGAGEVATVTLADGSSVRLGPTSRLRFDDRGRGRLVRLEGRAFFGVTKDSGRRFVVRTERGDVVVTGTRFEVRSEQEELRVLVVEGDVSVSVGDQNVELGKGEMSRAAPGQPQQKSRVEDVQAELAWMGNHLVFRSTPLGTAVQEIRKHFGVTVTVSTPDLEGVPVTATFTNRSAEDVVQVLCEIVQVQCELHPDQGEFRIGATPPPGPRTRVGG